MAHCSKQTNTVQTGGKTSVALISQYHDHGFSRPTSPRYAHCTGMNAYIIYSSFEVCEVAPLDN